MTSNYLTESEFHFSNRYKRVNLKHGSKIKGQRVKVSKLLSQHSGGAKCMQYYGISNCEGMCSQLCAPCAPMMITSFSPYSPFSIPTIEALAPGELDSVSWTDLPNTVQCLFELNLRLL